jgi:hypothetical protein
VLTNRSRIGIDLLVNQISPLHGLKSMDSKLFTTYLLLAVKRRRFPRWEPQPANDSLEETFQLTVVLDVLALGVKEDTTPQTA